jgi:V/A-type H+/Na+-transporting ATPase subunit D
MKGQVAPTRSNLLRLQHDLEIAQRGHDLLDEKRQALIMEVMTMVEDAEAGADRMEDEFARAYKALLLARMSQGSENLNWIALSAVWEPEVHISQHRIMGVPVSIVHPEGEAPSLQYGLGDTSVALDEAVQRFRELLSLVYQMAEMLTAIWRLTREIKKTQRHVKSLENVAIPRYQTNIKFIQETLEEKERDEFFRTKLVKKRIEETEA